MSFAIWNAKPPFREDDLSKGECIYFQAADGSWQRLEKDSAVPNGALFCVTDQGVPMQAAVDKTLGRDPNDIIEAEIAKLYAEHDPVRGFTELAWAIAQIRDIQNMQVDALVAQIRTLTNNPTFDVPRVPDLKKNGGMQVSKAIIDLRATKT